MRIRKMSMFEETKVQRVDSVESIESVDFLVDSLEKADLGGGDSRVQVSEHRLKEMRGELLPEPLLVEDKNRFVLFPIKHKDVSLSDVSTLRRYS